MNDFEAQMERPMLRPNKMLPLVIYAILTLMGVLYTIADARGGNRT